MTLFEQSGSWRPEDRAESQIRALAFDVPPAVDALRVELDYDRSGAGVVDLGCERPGAWVGWSGGARSHVVVSEEWSTPGYLPTPVTPGEWHVVLGLHRVPASGIDYRVTVTPASRAEILAERDSQPAPPAVPERPPARELPAVDGMRWRAGDFHAHTLHSDGALSIEGLAALAVSQGLDVLAVTDHNTTSHHAHLPDVGERYGIQLVSGQEVTTDQGHANAFGDIGFVDFRQPGRQWQRDVTERGGLLSVNHPLGGDCSWRMSLDEPTSVAEIWHSSWLLPALRTWGGPLAWWQTWSEQTVPVGGSDFHRPGNGALPGSPTTWVLCEGDDVLGAIRAGHTSVSIDPRGPLLLRTGDELVALGADGALLTGFDRGRRRIVGDRAVLAADPGPWWLEDDHMGVLALTP
jgi:hypothetical protein